MTVLEEIMQMKNQGISDEQIVVTLQEKGVSPKEINDALSQAQIKSAVSDTEEMQPPTTPQIPPIPQQDQEGYIAPQTQEVGDQEMYSPQEYPPQQEIYQQAGYEDYSPMETTSSGTMIEIAEQVFSEKMKETQKQIENLNEFKVLMQTKIDNSIDRIKKIETIIDKLQIAILEKIGSYGENLQSIKKEMSMMQDSFGKVVNQAVKRHKTAHKKTASSRKKISKKK